MNRLKYAAVWFLDWIVDDRILRHRFQRYCEWLSDHPWWGPCSHDPNGAVWDADCPVCGKAGAP